MATQHMSQRPRNNQIDIHQRRSIARRGVVEDSVSGWDQIVEERGRLLSLVVERRTQTSTGPCSRKTERKTAVYNEHCVLRYTCLHVEINKVNLREMCIF